MMLLLLIDEYDAPVANYLPQQPKFAESVAEMMKYFYLVTKEREGEFYKVFVTGVSKYATTSMFSSANNFIPIMENTSEFSNLYGFTETEICSTYGPFIEKKFGNLDKVMDELRRMYNGYCFHPDQTEKVFNPWSILYYLQTGKLDNHWATSAMSSKVVNMLGLHGFDILNGFEMTSGDLFAPISAGEIPNYWRQMAFQSGYATILKVGEVAAGTLVSKQKLHLGVPNEEV